MTEKWTTHHVTMPLDKAAEYLSKIHALVNELSDPGFVIALGMAEAALRTPPTPPNEALTLECCGTCKHCDPGDGAPYCDNQCSAHYMDCVAETDGCMWYARRPPEKGE